MNVKKEIECRQTPSPDELPCERDTTGVTRNLIGTTVDTRRNQRYKVATTSPGGVNDASRTKSDGLVDLLNIALGGHAQSMSSDASSQVTNKQENISRASHSESETHFLAPSDDEVCIFGGDSTSYLRDILTSESSCIDITSSNEPSPGTSGYSDATLTNSYVDTFLQPGDDQLSDSRERLFLCKVCPYRSFKKWDFMNHVRIHTGEKPFGCPYCEHRSALKNNLRRHILLKHGNNQHPV